MADKAEASSNEHQVSEEVSRTIDGDGGDIPDHLKSKFIEANRVIQAKYSSMLKQQELLKQAKEQALRDVDSCFDRIVQVANRRRQLLRSEITDVFGNHLEALLEDTECVLLSRMCLGTLLKQTKEISASTQAERPDGFENMVGREIRKHCDVALKAFPGKNLIEFDKTVNTVGPLERKLRTVGRVKSEHTLPALVRVNKTDAVVGLTSTVQLEIVDLRGDQMSTDLLRAGLVSFQLRDPLDEFVRYEIDTNDEDHVIVRFKPTVQKPHNLTVLFSATVLREVMVDVKANRPKLVIGVSGELIQPNAVCMLEDGSLFVVDSGAAKICLYDGNGLLRAEASLLDGNHIPFDIAVERSTGVLYCTGSACDDQDDTLSASPDDGEGLLPIDGTADDSNLGAAKCPLDSKSETAKESPGSSLARLPDTSRFHLDNLKILPTTFQGYTIKCIEKPAYIAVNMKNQIILSDPNANAVLLYDSEGRFLQSVQTLNLDCPAFVTSRPDGQVILSDVGSGSLLVGSLDFGLRERWGSLETDSGHQLLPVGLAIDLEGNLVVGDGSGPRLFVYGEWGECLGRMELAPAEIILGQGHAEGQGPVDVSPWGLAASTDGGIWVIDSNSRRVCKYKYTTE